MKAASFNGKVLALVAFGIQFVTAEPTLRLSKKEFSEADTVEFNIWGEQFAKKTAFRIEKTKLDSVHKSIEISFRYTDEVPPRRGSKNHFGPRFALGRLNAGKYWVRIVAVPECPATNPNCLAAIRILPVIDSIKVAPNN